MPLAQNLRRRLHAGEAITRFVHVYPIFHVPRELERLALEEGEARVIICDRGTVDSIHLRVPDGQNGYNRQNPVRIETAAQAAAIDERILAAWRDHPRRAIVASTPDFVTKLTSALELIRAEVQHLHV